METGSRSRAIGRWIGGVGLVYALASLALWPSSLLGRPHVEAGAVFAALGFFVAGLGAVQAFRQERVLRRVLARHLALVLIPLILLSLAFVWRGPCDWLRGLGLFLLFALPSVALGVALAYALTALTRRAGVWLLGLGLFVALVPVAYDLGLHPQLYTYNHVWGGALGPIYDTELAVRPGLFAFRGLTVLWSLALMLFGRWRRSTDRAERTRARRAGLAVGAVLVLGYVLAVPIGINTSYGAIERVLAETVEGEGWTIHAAPGTLTEAEKRWVAAEHDHRLAQLEETLGVAVEGTIHSYLYPDPETRAALIGSRLTSVTPVWLARPQIHMLADRFSASHFGHELAHVVAREFGMPVLRASLAVGLVEGLAVAVAPPDGLPSAAQQTAAARQVEPVSLGALDRGPAEAVTHAMNPFGFWTGRGAVSYVTTGAFTGYLLDTYGPDHLRTAYRTADFERAYGQPLDALTEAWAGSLAALPVSEEAVALAAWRFTRPSLFEQRCPHELPPEVRAVRAAYEAEDEGDAVRALRHYERALEANPAYVPALAGWAQRRVLLPGGPEAVAERLAPLADSLADASLYRALGDARALAADTAKAALFYQQAAEAMPPYAEAQHVTLRFRERLRPESLHALLQPGPFERRAARLEPLVGGDPALALFAALLWNAAGEPRRALDHLYAMPRLGEVLTGTDEATLAEAERQRLAWEAAFAYRAGVYAEAIAAARDGVERYRTARSDGPARWLDDLAEAARWQMENRLSP